MLKRLMDVLLSSFGLIVMSPILGLAMLAIWLQDFRSPFYIAPRVGRGGRVFRMVKLRSMVVHADRSGVASTSTRDPRITHVGRFIRRYKLDEFCQLWNVVRGDMSLVGPRPQVERDVALYTETERALLKVRPGITDIASIVFSDESEILKDSRDPDLDYNQRIRPWKSRFGLLYAANRSLVLDLWLVILTVVAILSRSAALRGVHSILVGLNANQELIRVARREEPLRPYPPPGAEDALVRR